MNPREWNRISVLIGFPLGFLEFMVGNALDPVAETVFSGGETGGVITKSFLDNFAVIGGSGATLCLLLALLFASRQKNNRQLAYSAFPLALFNINEILVFRVTHCVESYPCNSFYPDPPIVSMLVAYGAVAIGWMPIVQQTVNWTTPVFFSGYLATGSWKGVVVQLISVVLGTMLYIPFVRLSERLQEGRENYLLGKLTEHFRMQEQEGKQQRYLERYDSLGRNSEEPDRNTAYGCGCRECSGILSTAGGCTGRVIGAEALLRWRFGEKLLYPPLVVELAQKTDVTKSSPGRYSVQCVRIFKLCGRIWEMTFESR